MRTSHAIRFAVIACFVAASSLRAQTDAREVLTLTRQQAVQTALREAASLGVARADTAAAYAQLLTARSFQNPTLSGVYTKSTPPYHVALDLPVDYPALRGARVRAAQAGREASRLRFVSTRALVALAADTAYTRAVAARERLRLSARNAVAADSLRVIAERRRDAGDASDLDVELAAVNAGQQANTTLSDSLAYLSAVLDLQAAIGLAADGVAIALVDSLDVPAIDSISASFGTALGTSALSVAAARASVDAARLSVLAGRRGLFAAPSVTAGFETRDPTGETPGILPTVGVALPLPLFNRNRGAIALSEAERARAEAELTLAQVESRTEIARARRALAVARDKVRRGRALVAAANRVAALSATAYREGASPLPSVLEAQRNARDVLAQYVTDLADAWTASATLRALTLTPDGP